MALPDQDARIKADSTVPHVPSDARRTEMRHLGLSGFHHYVTVIHGDDDCQPGSYKVVLTLNRQGFSLHPEYQVISAEYLEGDSHLAIAPPAITEPGAADPGDLVFSSETSDGRFVFVAHANTRGFLGKLELRSIQADHFVDAERKGHRALAPVLSLLSIHLDMPLQVYQVDVTELRTHSLQISMRVPFREFPYTIAPRGTASPEFQFYGSLYREALNSNSPPYQLLCYFKIIEGVRAEWARREREAGRTASTFVSFNERVPSDTTEQIAWLNEIFPGRSEWDEFSLIIIFPRESLGRDVISVIDEELTFLRNGLAHPRYGRPGEPTFNIDEALNTDMVANWLPFTRCVARRLLRHSYPEHFGELVES